MTSVDVLVAVRNQHRDRYIRHLTAYDQFQIQVVSDVSETFRILGDPEQHVDVLVLDNGMGESFNLIREVRLQFPRLFIVLVDEEADFATPGQADDISVEPFANNDLIRRINRLMSDRQLETLRADSLPAVRQFAKQIRSATGELGKQQAAVTACRQMGFEYVAFYRAESNRLTLKAQEGSSPAQSGAPRQAAPDDLMSWVAQSGQSRLAGAHDQTIHPLIARGVLQAVAGVPVDLSGSRYGVLVAGREKGTITQENVLLLELVAAQMTAAISKDTLR